MIGTIGMIADTNCVSPSRNAGRSALMSPGSASPTLVISAINTELKPVSNVRQ